ncbi:MAG: hypothetical protein ACREDH_01590, partial [Methylocella sp.]
LAATSIMALVDGHPQHAEGIQFFIASQVVPALDGGGRELDVASTLRVRPDLRRRVQSRSARCHC